MDLFRPFILLSFGLRLQRALPRFQTEGEWRFYEQSPYHSLFLRKFIIYLIFLKKRGKRDKGGLEEAKVKWKELEIGDVIYLRSEETCPADIIVLDTNEVVMKEAICHIDTHLLNGKTDLTKKKASSLTQSNFSQLFLIFFYEKIRFFTNF